MAEQPTEDLWSVALCSGKYFLGIRRAGNSCQDHIHMEPCYEVTSQLIPVGRDSNGAPIISKNISAEPILVSFSGSPLVMKADLLVRGEEMKKEDQARYKRLADTAAMMCREARAAEANILLPKGGKFG